MKKILKKINYKLFKNRGIFYPKFSDKWYVYHQKKLRGSREEIKTRQKQYLPYINNLPSSLINNPFLEVGFGRGEFLELLSSTRLKNIEGVDNNYQFYQSAKKKGQKVYLADALEHLYLSNKIYSGISAFHFVEHLPFPQLFDFLYMCSHKIAKGGLLILETPNIENLQVASITYHYDFTHVQKLPSILLRTLLEFFKFSKVDFLYLNPMKNKLIKETDRLLFGAQDLGVIARKL